MKNGKNLRTASPSLHAAFGAKAPHRNNCGCSEFNRAKLLERAAAQAGRGLPAIEPGMPLPAGTGLDRRSFLWRSGAAMLSVYGASRLGFRALEEGSRGRRAQPTLCW